jgi:hypothetical protein
MAARHGRFVIHHLDAANKAHSAGQEQMLLTVNTDANGYPDFNDLKSRISGIGRLRGATIQVHSYVWLDHDADNAVNMLT